MSYLLRKLVLSLYYALLLFTMATCLLDHSCASIIRDGGYIVTTESPDNVENFNPALWVSKGAQGQQIEINSLKLETKVRLRYARTRIIVSMYNPHDKPLQASFQIILPPDSFFTVFKVKRGREPKPYMASVMMKEDARAIYHYAHVKTNGSITAGFIELLNEDDLTKYNMKFTLGSKMRMEAYLIYETQIKRLSGMYRDTIHIFPIEVPEVRQLEYLVDVEEPEEISSIKCSPKTAAHFYNCSYKATFKSPKRVELPWRDTNVTSKFLQEHPFSFQYELRQQNTSTAVYIHQRNGNIYFVHLFVPANLPPIPRHVVFLLDISDSMHGKKMDKLKWAMVEILDDLAPHDFFNIITFSTSASIWSKFHGDRKKCPIPFPATEEFKEPARRYIEAKMTAQGVTNIYLGMTTAFDLIQLVSPQSNDSCEHEDQIKSPLRIKQKYPQKLPENVESMIFFLSDGKASSGPRNPSLLLSYFHNLNFQNLSRPSPIYTIAFGSDADQPFLKTLASENGGSFKFIQDDSAGGVELANFYAEVSSTILSQVQTTFSIPSDAPESETLRYSTIPSSLVIINGTEMLTGGELYLGSKNNNRNRTTTWSSKNLTVSTVATGGGGRLVYESPVYDCRSLETTLDYCLDKLDLFVERLQAYQLLKRLMIRDKKIQEGYSCPKSFDDDFYSQNLEDYYGYDYDENEQNCVNPYKDQVIELAMKLNFITPYTSFILCTTPNIDIGLTGHIDLKSDRSRSRGPLIPDKNFSTLDPKVENDPVPSEQDLLPVASKLVQSPVDNAVEMGSYIVHHHHRSPNNELARNPPPKAVETVSNDEEILSNYKLESQQQWYSKSVQDFAFLLFKKLFIPKASKYNATAPANATDDDDNLNETTIITDNLDSI